MHAAFNWAFRGSSELRRPPWPIRLLGGPRRAARPAQFGGSPVRTFRIPFFAMGSACEVVLACEDEAEAMRHTEEAFAEVQRIEHKYSRYRADSVVSRINAAAGGQAVECDGETVSLLDYADALQRQAQHKYVQPESTERNRGGPPARNYSGPTQREQREGRPKCNIQPVMTDAEIAACR